MKPEVVIVEDERITAELLKVTVEEHDMNVLAIFDKAEDAYAFLKTKAVDLVLVDIHLKGEKTGIWLAQKIDSEIHIPFVYVTAYGDRATIKEAVAARPYGYLIKPFDEADITGVMDVAWSNFSKQKKVELDGAQPESEEDIDFELNGFYFIKSGRQYYKVKFNELLYASSARNYIDLFFEGKRICIRSTLKDLSEKLPTTDFTQINRSTIVNLNKIDEFTSDEIKIGDTELIMSDNYKEQFFKVVESRKV